MASQMLNFKAPDDLAEAIRAAAAQRGIGLSEFLRQIARRETSVDDEDPELLARLRSDDPATVSDAVKELLALNPVSLVHRQCFGDDAALGLVLAYADHAGDEGKRKLIVALATGIEGMTTAVPNVQMMEAAAEIYGHRVGLA